jgi:hypothetical protein
MKSTSPYLENGARGIASETKNKEKWMVQANRWKVIIPSPTENSL